MNPGAWKSRLAEFDPDGAYQRRMRQLLIEILEASSPRPGSAAHLRWRRDRALQRALLGDQAAREELAELSSAPFADEPLAHLDRFASAGSTKLRREIASAVLQGIRTRKRWFAMPNVAAFLACAALVLYSLRTTSHSKTLPLPRKIGYSLQSSASNPLSLEGQLTGSGAPASADLYRNGDQYKPYQLESGSIIVDAGTDGACFQLVATNGGVQYVSPPVRVVPRHVVSPPPRLPPNPEIADTSRSRPADAAVLGPRAESATDAAQDIPVDSARSRPTDAALLGRSAEIPAGGPQSGSADASPHGDRSSSRRAITAVQQSRSAPEERPDVPQRAQDAGID